MPKTITEASRKIKVWRECDVVVVGGGPGGIASAISAARGGAKVILIERYGHLGGMATGGLVNIIPNLSDMSGKQHIFGLVQEMLDRLDKRGGATWPAKEHWGTTERKVVDYFLDANLGWFYVRNDANRGKECALYTAVVDPEILKDEFNDMVLESGAEMLLHAWGTEPIMEGNATRGVIFESKSGRQAISAKIVIDSTGDGDMFVRAGAEFDGTLDNKHRDAWLALNWWVTNVDIRKWSDFRTFNTEKYTAMMDELTKLGGYTRPYKGILKNQPNTVWYHCMQPQGESTDAMDVEQLSRIDIRARKRTMITFEYMKKNVPGFENSFIMQVAPQLGTQGGRRVIGEYTL
ncbi:MAG TPA: FAD-dependent oxidoreductase, partial [Dehalococcoidales bacterium]|nr:FAD-dependent oxidoreductase [Dehalococcoidales bacterium]